MKKQILFLIFVILLTSCAQGQPAATPTFAPTTTPIPSATVTPIPTVTSTPTEVPMPVSEIQISDADGNTILVVNDQLYKWENSKLVPVEMENTTFENAIDASNAAMALAPAEYFEGDQQALKDILFPPGVKVNQQLEQMAFKVLSRDSSVGGIGAYPMYGVPISVTKVQSEPSDKFQLVVINMAVLGVDQPVPIVVGKVENGQHEFRFDGFVSHLKFTDDPIVNSMGLNHEILLRNIDDIKKLFGKPMVMQGVVHFRPDKYDFNRNIGSAEQKSFFELMVQRFQAKKDAFVAAIGGYPEPFKSNSGWINWLLNQFSGYDFDGFVLDSVPEVFDAK